MQNKNKTTQRKSYKVKNWAKYNKSLIARGSIKLWFADNLETHWASNKEYSSPGRPQNFSDKCIEVCLMVKAFYRLTYRQVEGFLNSFFKRSGMSVKVPSYTQLSRRSATISIPFKPLQSKGPVDIVIDSTGLKVFGEGEWKVRMHGYSKRRTWKKLHLAVDPLDHEVIGAALTSSKTRDNQVFEPIIEQIKDPIERAFGDSAYDATDCYKVSYNRGIDLIVPPARNACKQQEAVPWLDPRDKAIARIKSLSKRMKTEEARSRWKYERDYHQRSLAETAMYRFKRIFGHHLWSRRPQSQHNEAMLKVNLLNKLTSLGMPESMPEVSI